MTPTMKGDTARTLANVPSDTQRREGESLRKYADCFSVLFRSDVNYLPSFFFFLERRGLGLGGQNALELKR